MDLKRVIWHKAFELLLESIREKSFSGVQVKLPDGVELTVYPTVLILSADYEEQYVWRNPTYG